MKKILFIEDEQLLNEAYKKRLCQNYQCTFAADGKAGLKQAVDHPQDLIILDIILPGGINGFDVLRELKQNQITKDIKVIVLTNLEDEKSSALEAGAVDCLVKSNTSLDKIETIINKYLNE